MKINRAYKFELKPNNNQKTEMLRHAGTARFTWNWALAERKELLNTRKDESRYTDAVKQHRELVKLKKTEFNWMYDVSKCAPQEALRDLDKAFKHFYQQFKKGKSIKFGFPKFKKKNRVKPSYRLTGNIKVFGKTHAKHPRKTKLPRLTPIRIKGDCSKFSLKIEKGIARILNATISYDANRWFVSYTVEEEFQPYKIENRKKKVGVDLGIKDFAILSDGTVFPNPKPLQRYLRKMNRFHKSQARRQYGSKNYNKLMIKIANLHYRIRNIRRDQIHKITHYLVNTYESIVIEDLNVKGMAKNRRLSRALSDVNFGDFRSKLEYKSQWYNTNLIVADRFFASSKTCSKCGVVKKNLSLSERIYNCNSCNNTIDRDLNAAINLSKINSLVAVS